MAYPEVFIPPWVKPVSGDQPAFMDDQSVPFSSRFGRGAMQRQVWGDPIWGWKTRFQGMRQDERAALQRVVLEARGMAANVRMTPNYPQRGSFPSQELLPFGAFETSSTSGWTVSDSTVTLTASERVLRITRNSSSDTAIGVTTGISVTSGATYIARAFLSPGFSFTGNLGAALRLGSAVNGGQYGEAPDSWAGYMPRVTATMSGTALYPSLIQYGTNTGQVPGTFYEASWVSVTRCARVTSQGNNGNGLLTVQDLPSSTSGLLLPGDFFEINGELKRATAPLNTNALGQGYLRFRPQMAIAPSHRDAVIIGNPYGRFMLPTDPRMTENFGLYTDFEFDFQESYS